MKKVNYNNTPPDKPRTFPADPTPPKWACQNCRHNLSTVAADLSAVKFFHDSSFRSGIQVSSSMHGTESLMGSSTTRMDQSFVVLPKQTSLPRPPRGALQPPDLSSQEGKMMEDSFVVLPPLAASVYNTEFSSTNVAHHNGSGLNSTLTVLNRAFDIATNQTQVEQPLCLECMRLLVDELDKEVEDVNRDIHAYESCVQRMEGESTNILSEPDFLKEKLESEEEERKLEAAFKEIDKQCAKLIDKLKELETKSTQFGELEERYWNEFNNYQFQLTTHQEESDAVLAKTEVKQAHLELLKRTSLLHDAFPIGHDKEFGTINNFRLGRFPTVTVEWDETNAAWGQACLLLHTMTQYFHPKFLSGIKILPMGSYPCIVDSKNNKFELFGPVNMFWSTNYDRAMTLFLSCLKDFSEFANYIDKENKVPLDECFKLPYNIENDKVAGFSIIYKEDNSTKALRYMVSDLKRVLSWFVRNANF